MTEYIAGTELPIKVEELLKRVRTTASQEPEEEDFEDEGQLHLEKAFE
jgi:hypothetical protein